MKKFARNINNKAYCIMTKSDGVTKLRIGSTDLTKDFSYNGVYNCPVCRHGEISVLPLMEAFACDFCRHIFTANLEKQLLKMADSQISLTWRWDGRAWKGIQKEELEPSWLYWLAGLIFLFAPPSITGFASYLFPPVEGSALSWFPIFWTILVFLSHLLCLVWLVMEYYQFPVFIYLQAIRNRIWRR
jgi:hypothetical protein